ncbi:MAG: hypothetical protein ACFB21_10015 [Opitutales bacterium]
MLTKRIIPLLSGLIYLPVLGFFLVVAAVNGVVPMFLICVLALLCLAGIGYRLWKEQYLPKVLVGTLAALLGSVWLFQLVRRTLFVLTEGGMERADGHGSPLAFAIGLAAEGLLLGLPAGLLALIAALHKNPTRARMRAENRTPLDAPS